MDIGKHFKNNWKNYFIGILLVIVVFGGLLNALMDMGGSMSGQSFNSMESMSDSLSYSKSVRNDMYYSGSDSFAPEADERKVIKNADVRLESDNYDVSKTDVLRSVNAHNVIVLSEYENKYNQDYRNTNYKFKVPSGNLELFLGELKTYGEIQSFNVYTNDVTGVYADYTARLDRYRGQIVRYEEMLVKPNLKISDEIDIQNRIDNLEDSIFYLNSRIANIDEDVIYSDVSLTLREKPSVWSEINFLGLKDGFKLFVGAAEGAIRTILVLAGFLLPFVLVYGLYRGIRRLF